MAEDNKRYFALFWIIGNTDDIIGIKNLTADDVRYLCDKWMSKDETYLATWYSMPVPEDVGRFDPVEWITISEFKDRIYNDIPKEQ